MVKKRLSEAGINASEYSSHKLRHTAATLMLQNGVDVRAVQEVLDMVLFGVVRQQEQECPR